MPDRLPFAEKFTGLLFISAKHAAKRAHAASDTLGEFTETMEAVVLCGVVLEGGINDVTEWFEDNRQRSPLSISLPLPYGFRDMELRAKWSVLPLIAAQNTFNRGSEPWQSFEALVELRNYIVHLRKRSLPKRVEGLLRSKNPNGDLLEFPTAEWACHTVAEAAMFDRLTGLMDISAFSWRWSRRDFPDGLSTPGDPWPRDPV